MFLHVGDCPWNKRRCGSRASVSAECRNTAALGALALGKELAQGRCPLVAILRNSCRPSFAKWGLFPVAKWGLSPIAPTYRRKFSSARYMPRS